MEGLLVIWLIYAIVLAFFTAWVAQAKARGYGVWWLLGFLFGLIALLAVSLAPPQEPIVTTPERTVAPGRRKSRSRSQKYREPDPEAPRGLGEDADPEDLDWESQPDYETLSRQEGVLDPDAIPWDPRRGPPP